MFSILSLSVARRVPQLALLGVLGLSGAPAPDARAGRIGAAGRCRQRGSGWRWAPAWPRWPAPARGRSGRGLLSRRRPDAAFQHRLRPPCLWPARRRGGHRGRLAARTCGATHRCGTGAQRADTGSDAGTSIALGGGALLAAGCFGVGAAAARACRLAAYASVACLLIGGIAGVPAGVDLVLTGYRRRAARSVCSRWSARATNARAPPSRWPASSPAWRCRWR